MIEGRVNDTLVAVITIEALLPDGSTVSLPAAIDTGYDGELTLSREQIDDLGLPHVGTREVGLGDDSTATTEVHLGTVLWDGQPRRVMVLRAGDMPLVGMELMEHHQLTIEVRRDGDLRLEKLS